MAAAMANIESARVWICAAHTLMRPIKQAIRVRLRLTTTQRRMSSICMAGWRRKWVCRITVRTSNTPIISSTD